MLTILRATPDASPRDIAGELGTTPNNVYNIIRRLVGDGVLTRADGQLTVNA